jgi:hypothetical protein
MAQLISWVRGTLRALSKKDKVLLFSEIAFGVCALLFLLVLLRIFLD